MRLIQNTDSAFPLDFGNGLPGSGRNQTDAWNYFHINSVDKDDEGNYLLSARNVAALFKINGTTGKIIWQLGGLHGGSSFEISEEDRFAFQHHARFRGWSADGTTEIISFFDNSAHSALVKTYPYSRARIFEINHNTRTARAVLTLDAPDKLSVRTQGSVQFLPNGNIFVNWGEGGAITEFNRNGRVLFHSYLDSEPYGKFVQSYRGFRFNWTGSPAEEPAVAALKSPGTTKLDIYVSWNGDTETTAWRFYAEHSTTRQRVLLGEVERQGFETHATFDSARVEHASLIVAEAIGSEYRVLRRTRPVSIISRALYPETYQDSTSQWPLTNEL